MPNENDYRRPMKDFMSFLDDTEYAKEDVPEKFSQERLSAISPDDVIRWLNKKVYNVENPPTDHDMTPLLRASTVEQLKKSLSH